MPEKWKSAIPTPRSNTNKNNLEDNDKSTNKNQMNSVPSSAAATTNQQINNANTIGGQLLKKPSLKIKKREKLDTTLLKLLSLLPNASEPLDASNLLENGPTKRPKRCSRVGQKPDYSENH